MAKDPAFLFYPGDASEDTQFMNRLERGCYFDILKAQKKFRRFNITLIKKVLGNDFASCWPALDAVLRKEGELYFIGWADDAIEKRANWTDKSSEAGIRSARLKEARKKGTHTNKEWLYLLAEANGICPRCKEPTARFGKDHVTPLYQGGSDGIENIQPLCPRCNGSKGPEAIDFFKEQRILALSKMNSFNQTSTKPQPKENLSYIENENANENENGNAIVIENKGVQGEKRKGKLEIFEEIFTDELFVSDLSRMYPRRNLQEAFEQCWLWHTQKPSPPTEGWEWRQKLSTWLNNKQNGQGKSTHDSKSRIDEIVENRHGTG